MIATAAASALLALAPHALFGGGPQLSGDQVQWTVRRGDAVRVMEAPAGGGPAGVVADARLANGATPLVWHFAAGPALRVYGAHGGERLLAGSPPADWGALRRGPEDFDQPDIWSTAAGVVTLEGRALVVRVGPGAGRRIALSSGVRAVSAAGGLAAVANDEAVSVLDLASGATVRTLALEPGTVARAVGVSPEGDVALTTGDALLWSPAGSGAFAPVLHGEEFGLMAVAGGRIAVAARAAVGARVEVVSPDGRVTFRGPASFLVRSLSFDGAHVAFSTDHCQLVAGADAGAQTTIPAGPCLRTEVSVTTDLPEEGRPTRVQIGCATAAGPRCRVLLRVRDRRGHVIARVSGTVARGGHRWFALRPRGKAASLNVRATDPDGRSGTVYDGRGAG